MPAVDHLRRPRRALAVLATVLTLGSGVSVAEAQAAPRDGAPDRAAADVLQAARAQLGEPYAWGGSGPDSWDCSGLTSLWRSVGGAAGLPRVSAAQQSWSVPLPEEQAREGDLVFFGHPVTHVGLVVGGGRMIDASASRGQVVERAIWRSGLVRYGRVRRPGMPAVAPWTPPPLPAPAPTGVVADGPVALERPARTRPAPPTAGPQAVKAVRAVKAGGRKPVAAGKPVRPVQPAAARPRAGSALVPLAGLPRTQARPSSALALRAAARARAARGATTWTDVSLVRDAWRRAGGGVLPPDRAALVARGRAVRLSDARVGDLVVYNTPATHLGMYLGAGLMVDASATMGRVVVREVYATRSVRLVRLG